MELCEPKINSFVYSLQYTNLPISQYEKYFRTFSVEQQKKATTNKSFRFSLITYSIEDNLSKLDVCCCRPCAPQSKFKKKEKKNKMFYDNSVWFIRNMNERCRASSSLPPYILHYYYHKFKKKAKWRKILKTHSDVLHMKNSNATRSITSKQNDVNEWKCKQESS